MKSLKDARKMEQKTERFKAILFGKPGSGKSTFAYDFPNSLILDTENIISYSKFKKQIEDSNSGHFDVNSLEEMKEYILELFTIDHDFNTLVIDSISIPYNDMCNREIERLKTEKTEGTEFARHTTKAKRMLFDIGQLLKRIDMNVILIAHEKDKYENDKVVGKIPDIPDKAVHDLGTDINAQRWGSSFKGVLGKSRYDGRLDAGCTFDMKYSDMVARFGEKMFNDKSCNEKIATDEQVEKVKKYMEIFNISKEGLHKFLRKEKSSTLEEVNYETMEKLIEHYKNKSEP